MTWIRRFYLAAGLYDALLGSVFLFFFKAVYGYFGVTLPNHDAYIQFAALLLIIFGVGFYFVSVDPARNRDIIRMGILLKASYCGVVFSHALFGTMPAMWIPFAFVDLAFLAGFVYSLWALPRVKS